MFLNVFQSQDYYKSEAMTWTRLLLNMIWVEGWRSCDWENHASQADEGRKVVTGPDAALVTSGFSLSHGNNGLVKGISPTGCVGETERLGDYPRSLDWCLAEQIPQPTSVWNDLIRRKVLLSSPLCRGEHWGSERLSDLSRLTQLDQSGPRFKWQRLSGLEDIEASSFQGILMC